MESKYKYLSIQNNIYLKICCITYNLHGIGLEKGQINEVLSKIQPFAVDVSSGVETDRYKDKNKIISFMKVCRNEN